MRRLRSSRRLLAFVGAVLLAGVVAYALTAAGGPRPRTAADISGAGVAFHDRTAVVNGVRVHYVIGGSGPAVLLLTGFPETWYSWRKVMPALAQSHTVIAVDSPGIGESSIPPAGYDARASAADLAALIGQLGVRKASVVGHDLGGWVAYAFARFHPERTRRVAILEAGIPGLGLERRLDYSVPDRGSLWHVVFFMQPSVPERLLAGKEREFLTGFLGPDRARPETFSGGALDEYVRAYTRPGRLTAALGQYRAFYPNLVDNRAGEAPKLKAPVLVVGGARSRRRTDVGDARRAASDVSAAVIPDAGHYVMEEQPGYVSERLLRFLR